ncbi:MAG: Mrp/NBP35 family ATP-binding protein [Anaerolineae bacterium]|nr:Mrp/NBP35 family ATP-binding protein [Anaerolineae bacterium]
MLSLKDQVWQRLKTVPYPGYSRDVVSFGLVHRVTTQEENVTITLDIGHLARETQEAIAGAVHQVIQETPGIKKLHLEVAQPVLVQARMVSTVLERPSIRYVLAVGSGKGGVGKSTVAVNLAVALAQQGLRVGLMDTDVYGPNVPRMLGVVQLPPSSNGKLIPAEVYGLRLVSLGLLVKPDESITWRGPLTDKLIRQFMTDVAWGELDVLIADLPPGTGDVVISLAQRTRPDGAVVVVTPQEVALDDARRAVSMFRGFETPVLGVVENMSYFACPTCHTSHYLFGQKGGASLAGALNIPLLGEIPMGPEVREGGDQGLPAVLQPASQAGLILRGIALKIWAQLEVSRV